MKKNYLTEQESFWAGSFGSDYIKRNQGEDLFASNLVFFSKALRSAQKANDCIEFGANIGLNLKALKLLYPQQQQYAVEINPDAVSELQRFLPHENIYHTSLLNFLPSRKFDLVLIKTVLIHINPKYLNKIYDLLYEATGKYLLICEYYNPKPVKVPYRGHDERLFKRDFCGELLDRYSDLILIDYGFFYHRDPSHPQDDITWFLIEKR